MGTRPSLMKRLTASPQRLDADELSDDVRERRCVPVRELCCGHKVEVVGRIRAVEFTPSETVPTLRASLFDGTDVLELIWLGRRRITGIEPGRRVLVRGRVGAHEGQHAMYNPWYELLAPA